MMDFVRKLADRVIGVLSGFDRLLFRGMLRSVVDAGAERFVFGYRREVYEAPEKTRLLDRCPRHAHGPVGVDQQEEPLRMTGSVAEPLRITPGRSACPPDPNCQTESGSDQGRKDRL